MRVDWKQEIHGVRMLDIRNLLRHSNRSFISVHDVAGRLAVGETQAQKIVRELVEGGWLELKPQEMVQPAYYQATAAGRALACAKAVPRIGRFKADQLVEAVVQRIGLVNRNDCLLHYVAEARLFGSYIDPSAEDVGDIDIAIRLERRAVNGRDHKEYAIERAGYLGKSPCRFSEAMSHCLAEVRAILIGRSPYISLHDMSDLEEIKAASVPLSLAQT